MNVDSLEKGIVLDHIQAGKCMDIYRVLELDKKECSVAIIKNARSGKMGKKDILKIEDSLDLDLDVLGFIDPNITVITIDGGQVIKKEHLKLPEKIVNVAHCKNPRCITSVEQELAHIFRLTDREKATYRCFYCEQEYTRENP